MSAFAKLMVFKPKVEPPPPKPKVGRPKKEKPVPPTSPGAAGTEGEADAIDEVIDIESIAEAEPVAVEEEEEFVVEAVLDSK